MWGLAGIGKGTVNVLCLLHIKCYLLQAYSFESNLSVKIQNNSFLDLGLYELLSLFWGEELS